MKKSRELKVTLIITISSQGITMILMASMQAKEEVGEAIMKTGSKMISNRRRATREVTEEEGDHNRTSNKKDLKIAARQEALERNLMVKIGLLI